MTRLLVHVEGETEESFVNMILAPHLLGLGYLSVSARLIGNARQRERRGGIRSWSVVQKEILGHLRNDSGAAATTMIDYYGLPGGGPGAWPGRGYAGARSATEKAAAVEEALCRDIAGQMGANFDLSRFIPYVSMHEFEALLFSDCDRFGAGIEKPEAVPRLQDIRNAFENPEEIDDSPITAPSKRLKNLMPEYEKVLFGTLGAQEIGLPRMRESCPHFGGWLKRLEAYAGG